MLGLSEGVPGQVFRLSHGPVVADGTPLEIEVAAGAGWERWQEVDSFAGCAVDDTVFRIDRATGDVHFGPAVREPDGSLRSYGAVPPKGAPLRVPVYRVGGGPTGNVSAGTVRVLRSTVPGVDRVENRRAAIGGVAPETVAEAKLRGPLALRTRDRAVTAEDYDQLARAAAPQVARVRTVPADSADEAGGVRVLLVPAAPTDVEGKLRFEDLVPTEETLQAVAEYIDERRTVGARVVVEPPFYQGVTVVATLVARLRTTPEELEREALLALNRYYSPLEGGPDGTGWPFGRPVQAGEVYAVLQRLPGTELIEDAVRVRRRPGHREAGQGGAADRPRPQRAHVLLRPPDPGGDRWLTSKRGMVPGLETPAPVLQRLPGVLQDDEFLQRFVKAFDDAYAPIFATLDSLTCYFDPRLAPPDFLGLPGDLGGRGARRLVGPRAATGHHRRRRRSSTGDAGPRAASRRR